MDIKERLRRLLKLRFAIVYPLGLFVIFFSSSTDRSLTAGIGFIIAGLALRIWANGYAIKMDKLTTSGPYAFVRHPLYMGTMLIAIGFIVMLRIYLIGAVFFILMLAVYYRTIKKEETMLAVKFADTYAGYKKKIPAIFPAFLPYRRGEKWPFSFRRLIKSQEYKVFVWAIVAVIAFHLKEELMVEQEAIDVKNLVLIIIAFMLGTSDLAGGITKKY